MSKNAIPDGYYESEEYKKFCEERKKKYEELTGQSRTQYIDDQLKIKEETIKGYEKIKKEAEENPDKNIFISYEINKSFLSKIIILIKFLLFKLIYNVYTI